MGTIDSRNIIDRIIAADGYGELYEPRTVKIVEYKNMEGHTVYGIVLDVEVNMRGMADRYEVETEYIRSPKVIWRAEDFWMERTSDGK